MMKHKDTEVKRRRRMNIVNRVFFSINFLFLRQFSSTLYKSIFDLNIDPEQSVPIHRIISLLDVHIV